MPRLTRLSEHHPHLALLWPGVHWAPRHSSGSCICWHSPHTHASALRPDSGGSASPSHRAVLRSRYTPPIAAPGTGPVDSPWLHVHGTTTCSTIASASCCASASFVRHRPLSRVTELRRLAGLAVWTAAWSTPRCSPSLCACVLCVDSHGWAKPSRAKNPLSPLSPWPVGPFPLNSPWLQ